MPVYQQPDTVPTKITSRDMFTTFTIIPATLYTEIRFTPPGGLVDGIPDTGGEETIIAGDHGADFGPDFAGGGNP